MQLNVTVDAADIAQSILNAAGSTACARPLPHDLAAAVPITLVEPIGGDRSSIVLDRIPVRLYTWAETDAEAEAEAALAGARLAAAEGAMVSGTQLYRVALTGLPYPAHDPEHPDLCRAAQTAQLWLRATTQDVT